MDKRFLGILVAIVIIFAGIFAFSQHSNNKTDSSSTSSSSGQASNHLQGLGQKGVTLLEYGDYECPVCSEYWQPLKQVQTQFNSQIYFQFRNLPLSQIHPNAFASARAAEAAGLQGKYFQMHDLLYQNQDPTGQSGWVASKDPLTYFTSYAQQIGLNVDQFKQDYAGSKVNDTINADLTAFNKTGQQMATPTFFLDGKYIDNSQLVDSKTGQVSTTKFATLINAEIAKKAQ